MLIARSRPLTCGVLLVGLTVTRVYVYWRRITHPSDGAARDRHNALATMLWLQCFGYVPNLAAFLMTCSR